MSLRSVTSTSRFEGLSKFYRCQGPPGQVSNWFKWSRVTPPVESNLKLQYQAACPLYGPDQPDEPWYSLAIPIRHGTGNQAISDFPAFADAWDVTYLFLWFLIFQGLVRVRWTCRNLAEMSWTSFDPNKEMVWLISLPESASSGLIRCGRMFWVSRAVYTRC
jgi:hypothetical protein